MSLTIGLYDGSPAAWDDFVRRQSGWTHFHLAGWRTVIERVFGHRCYYLGARDEQGFLVGVLPLVRVKSWLFGNYVVSMPFVNYGGPLGTQAAAIALVAEASSLTRGGRAGLLEIRARGPLPIDLPVSHRKLTVLLDMPAGDPEGLWKSLTPKLRTQVRRSEKEGVAVSFGRDQLDGFFTVFADRMRELGTPTQSRRFFETIADVFPDDTWFVCAWLKGEPIAGGCGFRWGKEFEITWSSASSRHKQIRPNMLLFWSLMERASAEGCDVFNFGRSSPGSGTHEFKQKWGSTRDEPLWWYANSSGAEKTPSPDDAKFSWGPRLWRRLPTPIATALGPRIVRYIP